MLVLAPTRELAIQIQSEAEKFGHPIGIMSVCMYGGAPKPEQLSQYRRGVHVIVATPGRLNDFLEDRVVDLSLISYLVLDEADRMLDMGFEPQVRKILARVPTKRMTMLFSATWCADVQDVALQICRSSPLGLCFPRTLIVTQDRQRKLFSGTRPLVI